ncbi:hypothetical protein FDV58_37505 [Bradyrhizobium elkanii]|uniref:Uncharacterized protein n=1 Tax=Bradyrhizobium elkanii TaxID=29448 RepID=A0A4U6RLD4_BRAEL|nr:hypothetical protein [Bradyrhizobium sp. BR2003]TKV73386.1 hypothetical protein FDV58_37505 [Bradyrhizobium elkanii]
MTRKPGAEEPALDRLTSTEEECDLVGTAAVRDGMPAAGTAAARVGPAAAITAGAVTIAAVGAPELPRPVWRLAQRSEPRRPTTPAIRRETCGTVTRMFSKA